MTIASLSPDYIRAIAPYQGGRPISEIARSFGLQESTIVKLASNENPLGMSPLAREAMQAAAGDLGRYPDGSGHDLKQALVRRFGVAANCITLGNGSNDILELVARSFLAPGSDSIFSAHAFAVYALATQATGARAVVVPARPADLGHDLLAMAQAVTPQTRVIWVANPNNPTGSFLSGETIRAFLADLPSTVLLVLDEAYTEYLPEADRYNALEWVDEHPNLLVSRSFSKAFGMAGLRLGYGIASSAVTDLLNRVRQPFNVNSLALAAGAAALFDEAFLRESAELNRQGLTQLSEGLGRLGIHCPPSWGNFVLADLRGCSALEALGDLSKGRGQLLFQKLLERGVITRPVGNYGLPDHLRVSVGTAAENQAFLDQVGTLLAAQA